MKALTNVRLLRKEKHPIILAAGFFDGLHQGHRKVLRKTITRARKTGGKAWILTFDTHPLKILKPGTAPLLLTSNRHKLKLLERLDLDGCLLMPFTHELANLKPVDFIKRLRTCMPTLTEVFIGKNWRFGKKGKGDAALLSKLGREMDFRVTVILPVLRKKEVISSTRIREEIMSGNLAEAAALLGRRFSVLGTVTRGRTVGTKLGFPTANLQSHDEVLPQLGVYAVTALLDGEILDGVLNLGVRPTFGKKENANPQLELHLFDFSRELYGQNIEVSFSRKLRDEQLFSSEQGLRKQIALDIRNARAVLAADQQDSWMIDEKKQ